jgi:hypothetical protein
VCLQIALYNGTRKAIVAHNIMAGNLGITNDAADLLKTIVKDNVADLP